MIDLLPEDRVARLLGVAYDMAAAVRAENAASQKPESAQSVLTPIQAFEAMEALRAASPFPKGLDYDAIRDEAMRSKYANLA